MARRFEGLTLRVRPPPCTRQPQPSGPPAHSPVLLSPGSLACCPRPGSLGLQSGFPKGPQRPEPLPLCAALGKTFKCQTNYERCDNPKFTFHCVPLSRPKPPEPPHVTSLEQVLASVRGVGAGPPSYLPAPGPAAWTALGLWSTQCRACPVPAVGKSSCPEGRQRGCGAQAGTSCP